MVGMSTEQAGPRPPQVTIAGWVVTAASALLLVAVFGEMAQLHTIDTRAEIAKLIDSPSGQQLGLTVERATEILRWCLMFSGVAAVAAAVFGIYVLQRHQAARIGLTVVAVPVVLLAPLAGSLPGMVVGAGTVMLWGGPARDWFAGRPVRTPAVAAREIPRPTYDAPMPTVLPAPSDAIGPEPTLGWGSAPPPLPAPVPSPPPTAVRLACILTIVVAGFTALGSLVALAGIAANSGAVVDMVRDSEGWDSRLDPDVILPSLITVAAIIFVWCVVSVVLAAFTWRRRTWAWAMLIGCTGLAGAFAVVAFLTSPLFLVYVGACGLVLGWLCRRSSRAWFAEPTAPVSGPPMAPPPSGPPIVPQ